MVVRRKWSRLEWNDTLFQRSSSVHRISVSDGRIRKFSSDVVLKDAASPAGLPQMGLAQTIAHVIEQMPEDEQGLFWANIGFIGGLAYTETLGIRL